MIVPWGYGYCNIQIPNTQTTNRTRLSANFKVGSESKLTYEPIKIEAESKGHYIHRKVIGYRPNIDMQLYDYNLKNKNYRADFTKDYAFENINVGASCDQNNDWFHYSQTNSDVNTEKIESGMEVEMTSTNGNNSLAGIRQRLLQPTLPGETYRLNFTASASHDSLELFCIMQTTYVNDANTVVYHSDISETGISVTDNFTTKTYTGAIPDINPNKIIRNDIYVGIRGDFADYKVTFKNIYLQRYSKQGNLLEFLYNYYNNINEDNHIKIYPYAGGNYFWGFDERIKQKFYNFLIDEMEITKNKNGNPKLGNKLHIIGKSADIISKSELNYVIYRDTDSGEWAHIPYQGYPNPNTKKESALLPHRSIVQT